MPNFVTFDDGLTYLAITEIKSFGHERSENKGGGTWIKLRDGNTFHSQWEVSEIAEKLGPCANLHY
jgi:hypothetical protein